MPRLVEERAPVVEPALGLDDQQHPLRDLDARAERPRRLLLALLDVQLDVLLAGEVDTEIGEARLQRRQHLLAREAVVPFGSAEEPGRVPALRLGERYADPRAEEPVGRLLKEPLGRVEEGPALRRQLFKPEAEAEVEVVVVPSAELPDGLLSDLRGVEEDRVQVLGAERAARLLELLPAGTVGLVGDLHAQHAVADLLAVDLGLERRRQLARPFL